MMAVDFPAAHSMDTEWFAVDAKGHVGLFESGESGMVPRGVVLQDSLDDVFRHLRGQPAGEQGVEHVYFNADLAEAATRDLFIYDYDDEMEMYATYSRSRKPDTPLHVDQLLPALRKRVKRIAFPNLDFSQTEHVQPLEHVECQFWWTAGVAYLAGDGKTVRPMPGREAEFADFCREFRKRYPNEAKNLVFEVVAGVSPAKPKPKPRRKKR
jgi:hypothetical protein